MNARPDLPRAALEEREALVKRLMELIQTVTDEELNYIAEADLATPPYQIRKQEAALRTIIFKRRGRMTEKHVHYPGEVLSMVAEDVNEHIDRAFEMATAVLMINALLFDDQDGAMSLCWAEGSDVYGRIDPEFLAPILSGFRWLSEHVTEWDFLHAPGVALPVPSRRDIAALGEQASVSGSPSRAAGQEHPAGSLG